MKAKILANPKSHGKNFGVVFFDVFPHPEYESEVRIEFQRPVQSKTGLSCLVVRDCIYKKFHFLWPNLLNLNLRVQVRVRDVSGPNPEVRVRVLARMSRTWTGPDHGQSSAEGVRRPVTAVRYAPF